MIPRRGFCDLGFAKVDTERQKRRGIPEVIYCPGKKKEHLLKIAVVLKKHDQDVLLTKLDPDTFTYLKRTLPRLSYNPTAKIGYLVKRTAVKKKGLIAVLSAGTADIPIAEEASATAEILGSKVNRLYDVGVAGVHRLIDNKNRFLKANVIVVVAGMEGALASIVSGMVSCPVIAVPTSCGYGSNFGGLSALLTMLNSCSAGVAVVNIDNGFGAGYLANLINK